MTSVRGTSQSKELRRHGPLAWLRLARVFQKVERASGEHLRRWDLSVAQFDVLAHVGVFEGVVQHDLAESLLVTEGNVCQLLDRMEGRGLILRRKEGRANKLFLTRSEEHTSELQSRQYLVCRLLLEKKKKLNIIHTI